MKRVIISLAILFFVLFSRCTYSLTNFKYVGIAFDGSGTILTSQNVKVNIQLINSNGTQYEEEHAIVTTDQFGAYSVTIGSGTQIGANLLSDVTVTKDLRIKSTINNDGVWVVSSLVKPTVAVTKASTGGGSSGGSSWGLTGNSGTIGGTNFIGTTDNAELQMDVRNNGTIEQSLRINTNQAIFRESGITGITTGNTRGQYAVDMQIYRNSGIQVARGSYSTVSGGGQNTAIGSYSTVGGGRINTASQQYSTIGGGRQDTASGSYSTIGGGYKNKASNKYSTVGGGYKNVSSGTSSTIGGGNYNKASRIYSTVSGGYSNIASHYSATISGGSRNKARSIYSTVSGGYSNIASHYSATISGGYNNKASRIYSTVSGGRSNTASGNCAIVSGGRGNTASGDSSTISGGCGNTASETYSTVCGGNSAVANKYGQNAFASGRFRHYGDAQTSIFVVRNISRRNNNYLYLDGRRKQMTIPPHTSWLFKAFVIARRRDGEAYSKSWEIKGMIDRRGIYGVTSTEIAGTANCSVTAVLRNNALAFRVRSRRFSMYWVARVEVVEVRL